MDGTNILVIKHGALGDIVIATAGFAAIRKQYPDAHIVLLTTKPYAKLLEQSPYFNEIWVDARPKWYQFGAVARLKKLLNSKQWAWIYDLQTSTRSTTYHRFFAKPWPNISSLHPQASHVYDDAERMSRHALERLQLQLVAAGIEASGAPDVSWMKADCSALNLPKHYALLVPGGAPHRPEKRWPAEHYIALAKALLPHGITSALIGTEAESAALQKIAAEVPEAINLCGKTSIAQIAELARGAALAVGNDTGPMHIIAATNCPSTVLFSSASDPALSKPTGRYVTALQKHDLRELAVERVLASLTV